MQRPAPRGMDYNKWLGVLQSKVDATDKYSWHLFALGLALDMLFHEDGEIKPNFMEIVRSYPEMQELINQPTEKVNKSELLTQLIFNFLPPNTLLPTDRDAFLAIINQARTIDRAFIEANKIRLGDIVANPNITSLELKKAMGDFIAHVELRDSQARVQKIIDRKDSPLLPFAREALVEVDKMMQQPNGPGIRRLRKLTGHLRNIEEILRAGSVSQLKENYIKSLYKGKMRFQLLPDKLKKQIDVTSARNKVLVELKLRDFFYSGNPNGDFARFKMDFYTQNYKINGLEDLGLTLRQIAQVESGNDGVLMTQLSEHFGYPLDKQILSAYSTAPAELIPLLFSQAVEGGYDSNVYISAPLFHYVDLVGTKDSKQIELICFCDQIPVKEKATDQTIGFLPAPVKAVFRLNDANRVFGFSLVSLETDHEALFKLLQGKIITEQALRELVSPTRPLKYKLTVNELRKLNLSSSSNQYLKLSAERDFFEAGIVGDFFQVIKDFTRNWKLKGVEKLGLTGSQVIKIESTEDLTEALKIFFNNDKAVVENLINAHSQAAASFIPFVLGFVSPDFILVIKQPEEHEINLTQNLVTGEIFLEAYFDSFPVIPLEGGDQNERRMLPGPVRSIMKLATRNGVFGFELVSIESDNELILRIMQGTMVPEKDIWEACQRVENKISRPDRRFSNRHEDQATLDLVALSRRIAIEEEAKQTLANRHVTLGSRTLPHSSLPIYPEVDDKEVDALISRIQKKRRAKSDEKAKQKSRVKSNDKAEPARRQEGPRDEEKQRQSEAVEQLPRGADAGQQDPEAAIHRDISAVMSQSQLGHHAPAAMQISQGDGPPPPPLTDDDFQVIMPNAVQDHGQLNLLLNNYLARLTTRLIAEKEEGDSLDHVADRAKNVLAGTKEKKVNREFNKLLRKYAIVLSLLETLNKLGPGEAAYADAIRHFSVALLKIRMKPSGKIYTFKDVLAANYYHSLMLWKPADGGVELLRQIYSIIGLPPPAPRSRKAK